MGKLQKNLRHKFILLMMLVLCCFSLIMLDYKSNSGKPVSALAETPFNVNLARDKTVNVINAYSNDYAGTRLVDGSVETHDRWATNTTTDGIYWAEIDFGAEVTFNYLKVYEYAWHGLRVTSYSISILQGAEYTTIIDNAAPLKEKKTGVYTYSFGSYFNSVTTSKVKISFVASEGPSFTEIEVFNMDGNFNIATLDNVKIDTSSYWDGSEGHKALDGNWTSRWAARGAKGVDENGNEVPANANGTYHFYTMTFNSITPVDTIMFWEAMNNTDTFNSKILEVKVQKKVADVWTDVKTFALTTEKYANPYGSDQNAAYLVRYVLELDEVLSTNSIRLKIKTINGPSFVELKVFCGEYDKAQFAGAEANNFYGNDNNYKPAKALDGDRSIYSRWATNDGQAPYWFNISLGTELSFNALKIFGYNDNITALKIQTYDSTQQVWVDRHNVTGITGKDVVILFETITTNKVRLALEATGPTVNSFELYEYDFTAEIYNISGSTYFSDSISIKGNALNAKSVKVELKDEEGTVKYTKTSTVTSLLWNADFTAVANGDYTALATFYDDAEAELGTRSVAISVKNLTPLGTNFNKTATMTAGYTHGAYPVTNTNDERSDTMWREWAGAPSGRHLTATYSQAKTVNMVFLMETFDPFGGNQYKISKYSIEYLKNNAWTQCYSGTTIGEMQVIGFEAVEANALRLIIEEASGDVSIAEFMAFNYDIPTLDNIKVNGTDIANFAPEKLSYDYKVEKNTSVDSITITAQSDEANTVTIEKLIAIPGVVEISVKDSNDFAIIYKVNVLYKDSNTELATLKFNDTSVPEFTSATKTYVVTLPFGTTEVPVISATALKHTSSLNIVQAENLQGSATVTVTAEDGTTADYTITFEIAPSNIATLNSIKIGDIDLTGFSKDTLNYNYTLPVGTKDAPVVSAVLTDEGATKTIKQPTSAEGTATIEVVAADGVTKKTYTIIFRVEKSSNKSVSEIKIGGKSLTLEANKTVYTFELEAGTKDIPVITATAVDAAARVSIENPKAVEGTAKITIIAENGDSVIYTINLKLKQAEPQKPSGCKSMMQVNIIIIMLAGIAANLLIKKNKKDI